MGNIKFLKHTGIVFLFIIFTSCDKPVESDKTDSDEIRINAKGIIEYELIKVERGNLIDFVFRITNLTDKPKTFQEISQSINANFILQKKYIKYEKTESSVIDHNKLTDILPIEISKDGWEYPANTYGIASILGQFTIEPKGLKEFMILSAYSREELNKALAEKNCEKVLFRAQYSNPGDLEKTTNVIELK